MNRQIVITKEEVEECLNKKMKLKEIALRFDCSVDTLMDRMREFGLKGLGNAVHYLGEKNPAKKEEVKSKISSSVTKLWEEGNYEGRTNGMTEKFYWEHPNFTPYRHYRDYAKGFHIPFVCSLCGATEDQRKVDVHHVDEDKDNWLLTNLIPVCNVCHQQFHFKRYKQPYVTIGKQFKFESCHNLLRYDGACSRKHGHSYILEVFIRNRISPETGMVLDYKNLSSFVLENIVEYFDHYDINDKMNCSPTAENMLLFIWEILEKKSLLKGIDKITLKETASAIAVLDKKDMLEFYTQHKEDIIGRTKVKA